MNSIAKIKELQSKGYRVEARGPSVILFRPDANSKLPGAGEAYELLRVATVCGPWDHEKQATEFAGKLAEMIGGMNDG